MPNHCWRSTAKAAVTWGSGVGLRREARWGRAAEASHTRPDSLAVVVCRRECGLRDASCDLAKMVFTDPS